MESSMMVFRQNIKFLLKFDRRTQVSLAEFLEVDKTHLNHFLNYQEHKKRKPSADVKAGKRKTDGRWLSASYFDAIAAFFGVDLWMLFRDDLPVQMARERGNSA